MNTDWLAGAPAPATNPGGRPAKGHKGRQRKLICPECGFIAYATAGSLGLAPRRCAWAEGYCVKFTSGVYCPEHDPAARRRRAA